MRSSLIFFGVEPKAAQHRLVAMPEFWEVHARRHWGWTYESGHNNSTFEPLNFLWGKMLNDISAQHLDVSIVIRAYNEEAHIGKLMSGIAKQRLQPKEVILVDSGSTDATVAIAADLGARIVSIDKQDFTFGRALNLGCDAAEGDILVFASAHVYPLYDTWLEKLVAPFSEPNVALCYGRQQGEKNSNKFSELQLFKRWFPDERAAQQSGYFCNNANCAVRRSVWERLRYDETLTGLEDLDWAKRAQDEGCWLVYEPEAAIVHVHSETWPQVRNRYRREAMALRRIDTHAQFSRWDFLWLFVANVAADSRAARQQKSLVKEFTSILKFRFNQFLGVYQGSNGSQDLSRDLRERFYYPAPLCREAPSPADSRQIEYGLSAFDNTHPKKEKA